MFGGTRIARRFIWTDIFSDDKENVVSALFRSVDHAVVWLEHMWLNEQSGRDSGLCHCDRTCLLFSFHILDMCGRAGLGFRFSFIFLKDFPPIF